MSAINSDDRKETVRRSRRIFLWRPPIPCNAAIRKYVQAIGRPKARATAAFTESTARRGKGTLHGFNQARCGTPLGLSGEIAKLDLIRNVGPTLTRTGSIMRQLDSQSRAHVEILHAEKGLRSIAQ